MNTRMLLQTFLFGGCLWLQAQEQMPPKLLLIIQESVKPGKVRLHEQLETTWARAFARAKWPVNYLGVVSLTGPGQAWFLVGYDSYADWQKDDKAREKAESFAAEQNRLARQDGDLVSGIHTLLAVHRDDLSLSAKVDWGKMRYLAVETARLRPGYEDDYGEVRKFFNAAHPKVGMDHHHLIYQVASGAPGPIFMMLSPMTDRGETAPLTNAFFDAVGPEGMRKDRELGRNGAHSYESLLFAFNPSISYVSKSWVAADPEFWTPKPKPAPPAAKPPAKP